MSKIKIKYLDGKEYHLGGDKLLEDVSFSDNNIHIRYIDRLANFRRINITGQALYVSQRVGTKNIIFHNPEHRISIDIMSAKQRAKKNRKVVKAKSNQLTLTKAGMSNCYAQHFLNGKGSIALNNTGNTNLIVEDYTNYLLVRPQDVVIENRATTHTVVFTPEKVDAKAVKDELDNLHLIGDWDKPEEPPFPYKETGSLVQHLCDTIDDLQGKIVLLQKELTQLKGK